MRDLWQFLSKTVTVVKYDTRNFLSKLQSGMQAYSCCWRVSSYRKFSCKFGITPLAQIIGPAINSLASHCRYKYNNKPERI